MTANVIATTSRGAVLDPTPRLELRGITKKFGSLVANDSIDLKVMPGEIHALLGENGAGKSTLMNTLYGLYTPDAGSILVNGIERKFANPSDAIAAGIGMVHQHFMLIPVFTVAENVMLGREQTSGPLGHLSVHRAREQVRDLSDRYGLAVDPDAVVSDLPVGIQQRVEILKALVSGAEVLVLDEPTAVLTPQEIDDLIRVIRELRKGGTAIVFISHKLREVKALADRVTILRRGRIVGTALPSASSQQLASAMVGRSVALEIAKKAKKSGPPVLQLRDVTIYNAADAAVVHELSLTVHSGEIVGIAGVQGNGQEELVESIIGLRPITAGTIELFGKKTLTLKGASDDPGPQQLLDAGVGYVPEDRQHDGLIAGFSIAENLVLDIHDKPPFAGRFLINRERVNANAAERIIEFDIRTSSTQIHAGTLSGGNQQKVVIAREMSRSLSLLVVSQPTRGVDVGAQEFIYNRFVSERDNGTAVLLVSSELDEVLALADRIVVMYRGRIVGEVGPDATADEVGLMMAGVPRGRVHQSAGADLTALGHHEEAEAAGEESQRPYALSSKRSARAAVSKHREDGHEC